MKFYRMIGQFSEEIDLEELSGRPDSVFGDYTGDKVTVSANQETTNIHAHHEDYYVDIKADHIELQSSGDTTEKEAEEEIERLREEIAKVIDDDIEFKEKKIEYYRKIDYDLANLFKSDVIESFEDVLGDIKFPGFQFILEEDGEIVKAAQLSYQTPEDYDSKELFLVAEKENIEEVEEVLDDYR